MRIVVFSDTHGNRFAIDKIVKKNPEVRHFIFLGDGERELDKARLSYPDVTFHNVAGNCDYGSMTPDSDIFMCEGHKIIFCHGHRVGVKYGVQGIPDFALQNNADIALFGHTHERFYDYRDGVHILNPGSASCPRDGFRPSYAFIDIEKGGIVCNHVDL